MKSMNGKSLSAKLGFSAAAATALLLAAAAGSAAKADIVVTFNPSDATPPFIKFDTPQVAPNSINGSLNGVEVVNFKSTENLTTGGQGAAFLAAVDGELNNLAITAVPPLVGFSVLSANFLSNQGLPTLSFTATDFGTNAGAHFIVGGVDKGTTWNFDATTGENKLTFTAVNNEIIQSLNFATTGGNLQVGVDQLKQVSFTGVVPGPIAGAGLPALLAFGVLGWARRRKTNAPAVA